jgi:hypothetical protein
LQLLVPKNLKQTNNILILSEILNKRAGNNCKKWVKIDINFLQTFIQNEAKNSRM